MATSRCGSFFLRMLLIVHPNQSFVEKKQTDVFYDG
jgi:hypothetical protein